MHRPPTKRPRAGNGADLKLSKWHRRFGIGSALVVVWLAVTGALLGHTDAFGLNQRHIGSAWLLDWYGIPRPIGVVAHRTASGWVTQVGERVYFNERPLEGEYGRLLGAVTLADEIVVAAGAQLLLLTRTGELTEVLSPVHGVPENPRRIGLQQGKLIAHTEQGNYAGGEGLSGWRPVQAANVHWSEPLPVPATLRESVVRDYRSRLLTWERVMLDLHSGRLFGGIGVFLVDLAALAFFILAATGLCMWLLRGNRPGKTTSR